ncbi:hypothetical protein ABE237_17025 [Brevibacillus formosus]|uniref:hypothetical protein n=1 Tax=Brevibacillus TaxID=55080 RepID=UPI000D105DF1|nr:MULTISPECIES: hypothetical protein [Brevibacillus]MBG9944389.1 hypothetical protein [Brevibacillus formosus]MED1946276.1 hypothetical protein [Brevibacillus formosus]MED1998802.1 hypothetical protein [Brevibacillus formosus]MED2084141.1 hypothetical protein [Brevibacillus formosus]PSK18176.1 hypothetical protein C7R94_13470 [Brevibacillus sp. NRRL NRS-603]
MRKLLSIATALSIMGSMSVANALDYHHVSVVKNNRDTTTVVPGKDAYGRYGVKVDKGRAKATLIERCSGGSEWEKHDIEIYSTTTNSSKQDYWMKKGCQYRVELKGEDVELAEAYVQNYTN